MDYRTQISKTKHYINIPLPIFKFLCKADITISQEHVFMLHWFEGQLNGDWKSKLSISVVSERLGLSTATVKRAYSSLMEKGLIKRHDQGRCSKDPSKRAISITEVVLPEDLIDQMLAEPNRAEVNTVLAEAALLDVAPDKSFISDYEEFQSHIYDIEPAEPVSIELNSSAVEDDDEFFDSRVDALIDRTKTEKAEAKSCFHERSIEKEAGYKPARDSINKKPLVPVLLPEKQNVISHLFAGKIRDEISRIDHIKDVNKAWKEVYWAIKDGSLSHFNVVKAKNIAMKMLRKRSWRTPADMPKNWGINISMAHR